MRHPYRLAAAAVFATLVVAPAAAVRAAPGDPAVVQITGLDDALLATMKQAQALGPKGRFKKLEPAVQQAFDLPTMTRYAIGPSWSKFSPSEQKLLIDAFSRLSVASFAHNFNGFDGERFVVDPNVDSRGIDKIVKTQIVPTNDAPTTIDYRMRASGGTWKVIDVLLQGTISQLTIRRSDLASVVAGGDAKTIAATINAQADKLLAR
jgi:phospholipid transport system substrate-binding protein